MKKLLVISVLLSMMWGLTIAPVQLAAEVDSTQKTIETTTFQTGGFHKAEEAKNKKQNKKKDVTVYITKKGKKYHLKHCSYLKKSKIKIKLSEAKRRNYTPCSRCKPPK